MKTLLSKEQAEMAAALLKIRSNYISYCKPCNDVDEKSLKIKDVIAKPVDDEYWGVFVNDESIDLAYSYVDIGESKVVNLANLTGCAAQDTPAIIELSVPASSSDPVAQANEYFHYSAFAGAVKLYETVLKADPSRKSELQPQIIKCYYNLGLMILRDKNCATAADYFRQVLFINENDLLSMEGVKLAQRCKKEGFDSIAKEVVFLELRK